MIDDYYVPLFFLRIFRLIPFQVELTHRLLKFEKNEVFQVHRVIVYEMVWIELNISIIIFLNDY